MIIIYIDESGINYKKQEGYFKDGPYAIWVGVLIDDTKYFHIERAFYDLVKNRLAITDWRTNEIHASNLMRSIKKGKRTKYMVYKYFDELFQFLSKMHVKVVFGVQQKNPARIDKSEKQSELKKGMYSFLHIIEHELASFSETAILIADAESEKQYDQIYSFVKNELQELVFQRTKWRYNPGDKTKIVPKPKYEFEFKSNFIVDQLHYVESEESPLVQLVDNIAFVLRRVLELKYLAYFPENNRPRSKKSLIPIKEGTLNIFLKNSKVSYGYYIDSENDVTMDDFYSSAGLYVSYFEHMTGSEIHRGTAGDSLFRLRLKGFTPYK